MADKLFLDANIILDFLLKRNSYIDCVRLFELIQQRKIIAFATPSVIQITAHWLARAYGNERCKKLLLALLKEITAIESRQSIIEKAIESKINDVEDAIQYFTSVYHELDYFISNDVKLQKQDIQIIPVISLNKYFQKYLH